MENRRAPLSAVSRALESTVLRAPATRLEKNTTSRIANAMVSTILYPESNSLRESHAVR
jgi:hypothetical protein